MLQKCANILTNISVKELKASKNGEIIVSLRDLQVVCVCVCVHVHVPVGPWPSLEEDSFSLVHPC